MIFGTEKFNILEMSESVNFTPTTRFIMNGNFANTQVKIYKSCLTGKRNSIDIASGESYLNYKITIIYNDGDRVQAKTDFNNVYEKIKNKEIYFTPHLKEGEESVYYRCLVKKAIPYYLNNSFFRDAIDLEIISLGYEELRLTASNEDFVDVDSSIIQGGIFVGQAETSESIIEGSVV